MSERLSPSQKEVKVLEVGEVFRPFENLKNLPIIPNEDREDYFETIVESSFRFGDIQGRIELKSDSEYEDPAPRAVTPLGEVREVVSVSDGVLTIKEMPLHLSFRIIAETKQQLDFEERIEFSFAGKKYYVEDGVGDEEDDGKPSIWFYEFIDEKSNKASILLPYDPNKLSQIEMRIVSPS